MPRCARSLLPDGIYHATARGVARSPTYLDDDDYRHFFVILAPVVARFGWEVHALCLMPNHYHLVFGATRAELSAGMHRLNGRYAEAFNAKYRRSGHLFGDRFAVRVIEDERYLASACLYVVANPVRAGLCAHPAQWPWSRSRFGFGPT